MLFEGRDEDILAFRYSNNVNVVAAGAEHVFQCAELCSCRIEYGQSEQVGYIIFAFFKLRQIFTVD